MRLALLILAPALCATAQTRDAAFAALADRFFDQAYFRFNPTAGTSAGFHQYDTQLEDYSLTALRREARTLGAFAQEVERFGREGLSVDTAADRDLVLGAIRGRLLEIDSIRAWQKHPDRYASGLTYSIFTLISRNFAPPTERLRSVIARERLIPAVFTAARQNLRNPSRIATGIALEQLPGIAGFFRNDVPAAFKGVTDRSLLDEFALANAAVLDALQAYESWLRRDLLPRSQGDFRIGAEFYRRKLLADEMVDTPLPRLLEIGYRDLRRNQAEFERVAREIDPTRTRLQILQELENDHPAPGDLLQTFRDVLGGLRQFIVDHQIITIPSTVAPILQETPPFARALTFASMDTPGAFERAATEAYFNVTLPEAGWARERVEQHMAAFNRGTVISTAIHEAYPGHYVQFLWVPSAPSKVRKLLGAGANVEGWAHYCEQMMLDEGYAAGDRKLRLGQLQDALLRNARYIAGIEMHTGKMSFEQGVEFFVKEGYQARANAERETKRGTADPTYLVYTLGKLQIMKLREDYRAKKGAAFSLREFHDAFMRQGTPPIGVVRRALLGSEGELL